MTDPILEAIGEVNNSALAWVALTYSPSSGEWAAEIATDYREAGEHAFAGYGASAVEAAREAGARWRAWTEQSAEAAPVEPCPWYTAALAVLRPRRRPTLRPIKGGKE